MPTMNCKLVQYFMCFTLFQKVRKIAHFRDKEKEKNSNAMSNNKIPNSVEENKKQKAKTETKKRKDWKKKTARVFTCAETAKAKKLHKQYLL